MLALSASAVIIVFLLVAGTFAVVNDHDWIGWIIAGASLPAGVFAFLSYRARSVDLDTSGLTLRRRVGNPVRLPWADIVSIEVTTHTNAGNGVTYYIPTLTLQDGTVRRLTALGSRSSSDAEHFTSSIRDARQRAQRTR